MRPSEAKRIYAVLLALWPASTVTPLTGPIYEAAIGDLDYAATDRALAVLRDTHVFPQMPSIADIRRLAIEVVRGPVRSGIEAWEDVQHAVRKFGLDRAPSFEDAAVLRAVRIVGWRVLCLASETDPAVRARFCEAYDGHAQQARRELIAPALTGQASQLVSGLAEALRLKGGS